MEMRFRALLTSIVVLATISLVGCGHYTCGVTFGSSTCTPSSGGPSSSGGGGTQTAAPVAFVYFADDNNGNIGGAGFDALGNFDALSNFTAPTFPPGIDGGMVIAQKKWLYMPVSNLLILGFSIDGTSGTLTALPGSPFVNPTANAFSITSDPKGQFLFIIRRYNPAGQCVCHQSNRRHADLYRHLCSWRQFMGCDDGWAGQVPVCGRGRVPPECGGLFDWNRRGAHGRGGQSVPGEVDVRQG